MNGELSIEKRGVPPHRVEIAGQPVILGGGPGADIHVDDHGVSRQHCRLEVVGQQLVVTDLGSATGTFARGQRIQRLAIETGEDFFVGDTRVTFRGRDGVAANGPPSAERGAAAKASVLETLPSPGPPRIPLNVASPSAPTVGIAARAATVRADAPRRAIALPRVEGYSIIGRLGEGSMGTAYLARSIETGDECVLKTMDVRGRSQHAIFFIREVQMGVKLRHPNIVRVADFGESGGLLFLAMEYVRGGSLLDRIEGGGPLTSAEALRQLVPLANALEYASGKKFVHRDIKPANILLTPEGSPKLADFGVAKMLSETRNTAFTHAGDARGTPVYMSPEVLLSAVDADGRADLYSLGATYYHALAGQPPFPGTSVGDVLRMVASHEPEPLERRRPDVHPPLAEVIRRLMRKSVDERYRNATELSAELAHVADTLPA